MGRLKKRFIMGQVYAGPEQMGVSESVRDESEKGKKDMDETGKKRKKILKRVSIKRRKNDDTMLEAVYAAPDVLSQLANQNTKSDVSDNRPPYPLNNADIPTPMKNVYAAPEVFQRMRK